MGLYKIEGVVLRRRNLGEADRLVTVLSRDRGKLTLVARGARRPRSRLGGRLEPSTRFHAIVAEGRTLDVVSQVEVLAAAPALQRDLERVGTASVLLELADRALAERHPHPEVYRVLVAALDLVRAGITDMVGPWFAARLLVLTGHRPSVRRCVVCGGRLRDGPYWSAILGGVAHEACRAADSQAVPIGAGALALVTFLLDAGPAALCNVSPRPEDLRAVSRILQEYAEVRWEIRLRAAEIAGRVRAATPRGT